MLVKCWISAYCNTKKLLKNCQKIQSCYLNFKHLVSLEKVLGMNSDDQSIQPIKTWSSKRGKTSASCLDRCDCLFLIGWESSSKLSYTSHWSHDCFYAHAIKFVFFVLSNYWQALSVDLAPTLIVSFLSISHFPVSKLRLYVIELRRIGNNGR